MQFFTPIFIAVTLVVSALAAPHAAVRGETSTRDAVSSFLAGTQVGQGRLAARSVSVTLFTP